MPIVNENGSVFVRYTIPEEIDKKIPEYFYYAMMGELCSIHGPMMFEKIPWIEFDDEGSEIPETGDESQDYYDLDSSTGGWYEALRATCNKLNMNWLLEYWKTLEWYDSDIFDGIIEDRIIKKCIETEPSNCNPYYKYLVNKE